MQRNRSLQQCLFYHSIFPSSIVAVSVPVSHHSLAVDLVILKLTIVHIPRHKP